MRVVLGNRHAVSQGRALPEAKRATIIEPSDSETMPQVFANITDPAQGVWVLHAAPGAVPAWVASDSPGMATLLAEHFGGIEVRELEES